jgi:putative peptide zinc metalloprotease protein
MKLPELREDLSLYPGPRTSDGQPSWTLHDPSRQRFYQLDWLTFEILHYWSLGDPDQIVDSIHTNSTLQLSNENVFEVLKFLEENQLLQPSLGQASAIAERFISQKEHWFKQLLHGYLFFRIPLIKPDRLLDKLLPLLAFFFSRKFFLITIGAFIWALVNLSREWDSFTATLLDTLSWEGMISYAIAIIIVKIIHEFGHALTAKRYGCRVPTMGVAFLVLWPVAYTDTSEVWLLTHRKQRLVVAAAGVAAELVVAVWAALAWTLLPDGHIRSMAFVLATISWVSTVLVNISPFMRFDGYFLLADWLNIPNLHARAFALARWKLREWLFALGEEPPEYFPLYRRRYLILFAWLTWIYRLALFLAIAVLVYHFFIKIVGICLFLIEIIWFVLRPLHQELREWIVRWPSIRRSPRLHKTTIIGLLLVLMVLFPWPTHIVTIGMLRPAERFILYAPKASQVEAISKKDGDAVAAGETIIKLRSPELEMRLDKVNIRIRNLQWLASSSGLNKALRDDFPIYQQTLLSTQDELSSIQMELKQLSPTIPFKGYVRDLQQDLRPGQWVMAGEPLAIVINPKQWIAETYMDEDSVHRIAEGDSARFYSQSGEGPVVSMRVASIENDATRVLNEGIYASQHGGQLMMREKNGHYIAEHAIYHVRFIVLNQAENIGDHHWRGRIVINGSSESPLLPYVRKGLSVIWRELGF